MNAAGEPSAKVGSNLGRREYEMSFCIGRPSYLRPVREYTFTVPSIIATAQKPLVALTDNTCEGK